MLAAWNGAPIHQECRAAYSVYESRLRRQYQGYFRERPDLRSGHPLLAKNLTAALPAGWGRLTQLIPRSNLHRWHLSGKSSQILGLGLMGPAREADPSGRWLWEALEPPLPGAAGPASSIKLEEPLPRSVLNEHPHQTAIDLLVESADELICVEMKWAEPGMGTCSCRPKDRQLVANCSAKVLARPLYWQAAEEVLGLPTRRQGRLCPISWSYQAVRNVAAARALSKGRQPVFALIYDENNPYFGGTGDWPGWPAVLEDTINGGGSEVRFASASWQALAPIICQLDGMDRVRDWAREKHGLEV
jgi:hypothetical protein